ncbi:MAG: hypothetical protein M3P06_05900 [Acidobacteriota bacterium]|nr:hypothetical protein [Acidobacteriota bacterium]
MSSLNPFIGLRPYTKDDAPQLFGRDRDLSLMLDRVLSGRTTLLFAASGAGKTSFLNAKLVPSLNLRAFVFVCRSWAGDPKSSVLHAVKSYFIGSDETMPPSLQVVLSRVPPFSVEQASDSTVPVDAVESLGTGPAVVTLTDVVKSLAPDRCIFILDQFEEVFNSSAWDAAFYTFLDELSAIINDERMDVRVVFSMREEFLGDLSVFDNRIPDLFNNYYRLKNPNREQGQVIVERTCTQAGAEVAVEHLPQLMADLSLTIRGSRETGWWSEVETDTVVLPYMQLVCHQLWENNIGAMLPFLGDYLQGDAIRVRDKYCADKLSTLEEREQLVLSQALDYLITKRGAKVPCEAIWLSQALQVTPEEILVPLRRLSDKNTRILKEFYPADGSTWFELYHDMYGPFLARWRDERKRAEEEKELARRLNEEKEWKEGIRPEKIAEWEKQVDPLDDFWVYLPDFLAGEEHLQRQLIDIMAHNMATKGTHYLYIVESHNDVSRLLELVTKLRQHPTCQHNNVSAMVRVLVLSGIGTNGVAQAVSGLLHLGNCWIANPHGSSPEGYEVAWDEHGLKPTGGRRLPRPRMERIITNISAIISAFPPPTFESASESNLEHLVERSPLIRIAARTDD